MEGKFRQPPKSLHLNVCTHYIKILYSFYNNNQINIVFVVSLSLIHKVFITKLIHEDFSAVVNTYGRERCQKP